MVENSSHALPIFAGELSGLDKSSKRHAVLFSLLRSQFSESEFFFIFLVSVGALNVQAAELDELDV